MHLASWPILSSSMGLIMDQFQGLGQQRRSITPFEEAIAGIGSFFSSAIRELAEGLEAGTEEGVWIAIEKFEDEARRATGFTTEIERMKAERSRTADEQRQRESRVDEAKRLEDGRNRAAKQKIRDSETAFWTTPGLRPLAEPPILDWDWFFRDHIPSDLRYEALFPDDPDKRCRIKDLHGEKAALHEYSHCAALHNHSLEPEERREFYANLMENLIQDWRYVDAEFAETYNTATPLAQFEFRRLDNDGKTTRLENWLEKGADIFSGEPEEVGNKYWHLIPSGWVEDPLATFSYLHEDGATEAIKQQMLKGNDVLIGWPKEVQQQHGYLRRFLPPDDAQAARSPSRHRWNLPPTLTSGRRTQCGSHRKGKLDISLLEALLKTSRSESTTPLNSSLEPEERNPLSNSRPS